MKNVWIAFGLLAAMLAFTLCTYRYLDFSSGVFLQQAEEIGSLCTAGQYEDAQAATRLFYDDWERESHIYYLFLPHDGVLQVSASALDLMNYIAQKDTVLMQTEADRLCFYIEKILSDETFSIDNLF